MDFVREVGGVLPAGGSNTVVGGASGFVCGYGRGAERMLS